MGLRVLNQLFCDNFFITEMPSLFEEDISVFIHFFAHCKRCRVAQLNLLNYL